MYGGHPTQTLLKRQNSNQTQVSCDSGAIPGCRQAFCTPSRKKKSTHIVETSVSHFEGNTVAYAVFIVDKLRVASWKASSLQKASCHRHQMGPLGSRIPSSATSLLIHYSFQITDLFHVLHCQFCLTMFFIGTRNSTGLNKNKQLFKCNVFKCVQVQRCS